MIRSLEILGCLPNIVPEQKRGYKQYQTNLICVYSNLEAMTI